MAVFSVRDFWGGFGVFLRFWGSRNGIKIDKIGVKLGFPNRDLGFLSLDLGFIGFH